MLLDGGPDGSMLGATPWDSAAPIVLDTSAARALGFTPVGTYAQTVPAAIDWLIERANARDLAVTEHPFFEGFFDYAAEDAHLARPASRG